ncbi:MAG: acyl dehydratase, partial [SAR324 cluster bacterium]|nr:acyl dehydratase [SAR324 cluster bacterium]
METVGLGFYFEDLPVGRSFKTIGRTITDADITNFVNATGLVEVLFTNLEFLREES